MTRVIALALLAGAVIVIAGIALAGPAPATLVVNPTSDMNSKVDPGGSPQPPSFSYSLTATRSQINWKITGFPQWLQPSAASGRTPAAVTFTFNATGLTPGTYTAAIRFSGQGTDQTTVAARLLIAEPPPEPPPTNYLVESIYPPVSYVTTGCPTDPGGAPPCEKLTAE